MLSKKISSLQHDIVKRARKLRENGSFRKENRATILSGAKILMDLAEAIPIKRLFHAEGTPPLPLPAEEVIEVPVHVLEKITGHPSPDGHAAEVSLPEECTLQGDRLLALDAVQDPSNLGAIFRSARAFGIDMVLLLPGCADPFHEKAVQAARGTQFQLPFAHCATLPDLPCFGAALNGTPLPSISLPKKYILALGNEGHGLSPSLEKKCTKISIPIQGVESLNVAVAAGILLYETARAS